jgi:hypothetical protein
VPSSRFKDEKASFMTATEWKGVCAEISSNISLEQLDRELERVPHLTDDERAAIWLYAWASRETAARVGELVAA